MKKYLLLLILLVCLTSGSQLGWAQGGTFGTGGNGSGAQGPPGPQGPAGKSLLNGTVNPANTVGNDGDFYLNTASSVIFGPKASGAWPGSGTNIIGPAGATGPQGVQGPVGTAVQNGTGAPGAGVGNNGDFYIDTAANKIYGPKASGAWPSTGVNLVGPTGSTGPAGPTGPVGPIGPASSVNATNIPTAFLVSSNQGTFYFGNACNGTDCTLNNYHVAANGTVLANSVRGVCFQSSSTGMYLEDFNASWYLWNGTTFASTSNPGIGNCGVVNPFTIVTHAISGVGGTSSTQTVTLTVTSGDTLIVGATNSNGSQAISSITSSPNDTGSCSQFTGANGTNFGAIWHCAITASGSTTITVTWAGSNVNDAIVAAFDLNKPPSSPDDGIGNYSQTGGTSLTVSGTATSTQADFVVAVVNAITNASAPTWTAGSCCNIIDQTGNTNNSMAIEYYVQSIAAQITTTISTNQTNSGTSFEIAGIKAH